MPWQYFYTINRLLNGYNFESFFSIHYIARAISFYSNTVRSSEVIKVTRMPNRREIYGFKGQFVLGNQVRCCCGFKKISQVHSHDRGYLSGICSVDVWNGPLCFRITLHHRRVQHKTHVKRSKINGRREKRKSHPYTYYCSRRWDTYKIYCPVFIAWVKSIGHKCFG